MPTVSARVWMLLLVLLVLLVPPSLGLFWEAIRLDIVDPDLPLSWGQHLMFWLYAYTFPVLVPTHALAPSRGLPIRAWHAVSIDLAGPAVVGAVMAGVLARVAGYPLLDVLIPVGVAVALSWLGLYAHLRWGRGGLPLFGYLVASLAPLVGLSWWGSVAVLVCVLPLATARWPLRRRASGAWPSRRRGVGRSPRATLLWDEALEGLRELRNTWIIGFFLMLSPLLAFWWISDRRLDEFAGWEVMNVWQAAGILLVIFLPSGVATGLRNGRRLFNDKPVQAEFLPFSRVDRCLGVTVRSVTMSCPWFLVVFGLGLASGWVPMLGLGVGMLLVTPGLAGALVARRRGWFAVPSLLLCGMCGWMVAFAFEHPALEWLFAGWMALVVVAGWILGLPGWRGASKARQRAVSGR